MDKFPRDKQNELLLFLYDKAPNDLTIDEYNSLVKLFETETNLYLNLWYLYRHGLIESFYTKSKALYDCDPVDYIEITYIHITERGVDFIRDDGGLSSILNVMTIKIHNETIEKLEDVIKQSHLTAEQKSSYLGKLRELPAETTKHLVLKLLDLGLSRSGDVIQLISSYFHS